MSENIFEILGYIQSIINPSLKLIFGALQVLDLVTGFSAGFIDGKASSKVGRKGLLNKVNVWVYIVLAAFLQYLTHVPHLLTGTTMALIFFEMVSITENLGRSGLQLPLILEKALVQLKPEEPTKDVAQLDIVITDDTKKRM